MKFRLSPSQVSSKNEHIQKQAANRVRLMVLKELCVELSEEQERFHEKIMMEPLIYSMDNLLKFKDWFEDISEFNRQKKVFIEPFFSTFISKYYFDKTQCMKRFKSFHIYRNSKLFEFYNRGGYFSIALFKIKSLIKLLIKRTR